jgi:1,4-alpha-glucan branching enzyme
MMDKKKKALRAKNAKGYSNGKSKRQDAKEKLLGILQIMKQYLRSRDLCKVTFRLPKEAAPEAGSVCLVGEFNGWDFTANPMKRLRSGDFTTTLELAPGREYQFRYLIDESVWENDWHADKYEKGPYGSDNSVIVI